MFSFEVLRMRATPLIAGVLVVLAGISLSACNEAKSETASAKVIRPVKVVKIARTDDQRELDYSGSVKARTEMNVGFRVAGKIIERLVDVGDRVKPGEVLARLDPTDYDLAVKTAKANLAAAEKQVETAGLTKGRAKQLFARSFSSQADLDAATLGYQQAAAAREAAVSALQQAKDQVRYTQLKADQGGIVTAVSADRGEVVNIGTPVMTVAVDGEKEVQIAVPETDISHFRRGMPVEVSFWTDDHLTLPGKVREIAGSADAQSRTFSVRVSLPDDPRVLLGMTATVSAEVKMKRPMITIPLEALARKNGQTIAWVVDRTTSTVHARKVEAADFAPDGVRVAQGLKPGDIVVAAGTQFMTDGLKVKLPDGPQSATVETAEATR